MKEVNFPVCGSKLFKPSMVPSHNMRELIKFEPAFAQSLCQQSWRLQEQGSDCRK
jgi:hypothetical protein